MNRLSIQFEDLIKRYRKHANDTGSSECQIILLTQRINDISSRHISKHHKDYSPARSLVKWVATRHKHQRYLVNLYKHNAEKLQEYRSLIKELGLRR